MGPYEDMLSLSRPVSSRHPPMRRADRAKQFMPFAAVTGLDEAIRQVELKVESRKEVERIPDGEELLGEERNLSDEANRIWNM